MLILPNAEWTRVLCETGDYQSHATAVGVDTVVGVVTVSDRGEAMTVGEDSISVEGNLSTVMPSGSFGVDGGGISEISTFRFLPFGAGSSGGDLL